MFSSETDLWSTPQEFYDKLHKEFNFTLDVCATNENAKCKDYYTIKTNGLEQIWYGRCWMNPPYGKDIALWVRKAFYSVQEYAELVACLLPARTDTEWWHDYCMLGEDIRFIRGRLKFGGQNNPAPFPSAVVIFKKEGH